MLKLLVAILLNQHRNVPFFDYSISYFIIIQIMYLIKIEDIPIFSVKIINFIEHEFILRPHKELKYPSIQDQNIQGVLNFLNTAT